eukprot:403993-Amphidinium_carterae.1
MIGITDVDDSKDDRTLVHQAVTVEQYQRRSAGAFTSPHVCRSRRVCKGARILSSGAVVLAIVQCAIMLASRQNASG